MSGKPHHGTANRLLFVENVGQFDPRVRFEILGGTHKIRITDDALWLTVVEARPADRMRWPELSPLRPTEVLLQRSAVHLRLSFIGSNTAARAKPVGALPTVVSYLHGSDPALWHRAIPVWSGIVYSHLYPGVDLHIQGGGNGMEWHMKAQRKASVDNVRLRVEGAERISAAPWKPRKAVDSPVDGLDIFTPLGCVFVPSIGIDRHMTATMVIERVDLQVFDVSYPFASKGRTSAFDC